MTGRHYSEEVLRQAVKALSPGRLQNFFGELRLPIRGQRESALSIDMNRISHRFTDLRFENDAIVADVHVLSTPSGHVLRNIIEKHPTKLSFVMRGVVASEDDEGLVVRHLDIVTFDAVCDVFPDVPAEPITE